MTYELKLDLLGGEKVEAILQKLQGLTSSLGQGGSVFGGKSGAASPVSKQTEDISKLTKQVQAGTVGVHALGKALKNLGETPGVNISLGGKKAGGVSGEMWNKILARMSPEDRAREEARMSAAGMGDSPVKNASKKIADKIRKDTGTFWKDMTFLMMPVFNPASVWATLFSSRQTFSALNTGTGQSMLKKISGGKLSGLSGAAIGTGALVGASTLIGLTLNALAKVLKESYRAYEQGSQIYSKALQNGMGLQFSTKRSQLASIMGVSEQDVMKFGSQMAYLNPKLEMSSYILSKYAPNLTAVSWEFKVLGEDTKALFATIANDLAPAFKLLAVMLQDLAKGAAIAWKMLGKVAFNPYLNPIGAAENWLIKKLGGSSNMPAPQAWMKQLPASSWEKMGLVTMGGTQNYAKDTAKNTREIANAMKIIIGQSRGKPQNSAFGMSPSTAQP
jgi:hypothetical protein